MLAALAALLVIPAPGFGADGAAPGPERVPVAEPAASLRVFPGNTASSEADGVIRGDRQGEGTEGSSSAPPIEPASAPVLPSTPVVPSVPKRPAAPAAPIARTGVVPAAAPPATPPPPSGMPSQAASVTPPLAPGVSPQTPPATPSPAQARAPGVVPTALPPARPASPARPAAAGGAPPGSKILSDRTPPPAGSEALAESEAAEGNGEGHENEPDSTLDILDEDTRLESGQGQEGEEPVAGQEETGGDETAAPGRDSGEEEALGQEAPAGEEPAPVGGVGPDGAEPAVADQEEELFPSSPGIELQKEFWIAIFTRYNSHQGVLHDGRIALPVYQELDLTGMKYKAQRRYVRSLKRELADDLRALARAIAEGEPLDEAQQALRARLPDSAGPREIIEFAENVRFQRGLADRFRDGLIQSGAILEEMRTILERHGVPKDLVFLPHVESSFNNATLSKFGAAGIWQFTRGTGRQFMRVAYEVDERLDPIIATEAAARFLRQNYEKLGNWPLAITAYNHGPQNLQKISKRMGTRDLAVLIERYDGRLFKFASKNFYAEFLAAREVAHRYRDYFGPLEMDPPLRYAEVKLPFFLAVDEALRVLGVERADLVDLNPALRGAVWNGSKHIPAGYGLRIPDEADPEAFLAAVPEKERFEQQKRSTVVRVAYGDTLYSIGRRNGISWRAIAEANGIRAYNRLRPGQTLILPWDGERAVAAASPAEENRPAVEPAQIVERIPVASLPKGAGMAEGERHSSHFQQLLVLNHDPVRKEGEIVPAYGETLGLYADWAGVTLRELQQLNGMSWRTKLRPGATLAVPLDAVSPEEFDKRRLAFHQEREDSFFAEYDITEVVKVEVRRGQSPWNLAQNNNVPMWLFYRENPNLLTEPMRAGMQVVLPIVQEGGRDSGAKEALR